MTPDEPWLNESQQRLWRRWLAVSALLPVALHRALQAESGLSLSDFDVLVRLTESPHGQVRVCELAGALEWERSRVSHHVTRMERRGLVSRQDCPDDARGAFVVITPQGRTAIERAAPGHVAQVRRLVFDNLTEAETQAVDAGLAKIQERLEASRRSG